MGTTTTELFAGEDVTGEVIGVYYADAESGFGVVEVETARHGDRADGGGHRADGVGHRADGGGHRADGGGHRADGGGHRADGGGHRADGGDGIRCSGPLADLVPGQTVRLVGAWRDHPKYGPTFEVTYYEQTVPTTTMGLRAFLSSERFSADTATVDRILTVFGDQAGWVIQRDPERLRTDAGIEGDVAETLNREWKQGQAYADLVRLVEPADLPQRVVRDIFGRFGVDAADVARADPYALLDAPRCRFAHADALARHLGLDVLDPRRLAAGARAAHADARFRDGHQYLTREQCVAAASRLLSVDMVAATDGLGAAVADGSLCIDTVGPVEAAVYTPSGRDSEQGLAEDVARLRGTTRSRVRPFADEVSPSTELTDGQARAVHAVFQEPVSVLTGGPGTGKTRTIEEVVRAAEDADLNIAMCAPTGRAAKRIEELVRRPATTVHRLLEARPVTLDGGARTGGFTFRYGRDERLPHDLVICDEVSMCDTWLAARLVAAVDDGAHLLLVGDPDQLPSVGPGDVLRDLIRAEVVPTIELTEVHRQASSSRIVSLANEVNRGELSTMQPIDGDVFLAEEPVRDRIVPRVVEAVANRIPDYFDVTVDDVQVVAPIYRGPAGVDALNAALKEALNPAAGRPDVAGFHEGDRVMQTRNDAELDVSNGDVGHVVDVDAARGRLRVAFPRDEVTYGSDQTRDLTIAWAVTVHKSQGGEWPVIVFVCDRSHRGMLWRNLAYTAITRAQRALIVVGQQTALADAAGHDRPRNRQTLLATRLRREFDADEGTGS